MKLDNRFYLCAGLVLTTLLTTLYGCDKTMTPYKKYVDDHEIVYPAKLDSFELYSGRDRVEFRFPVPPDPRIDRVKIYWHNGQDSIEATFPGHTDTLVVDIPHLTTEGSYTFDIYTFDKAGNKSVKSTRAITVYGDEYERFLLNRPINKVVAHIGGNTVLDWGAPSRGAQGTIINYTDTTGKKKSLFVPTDSLETELPDLEVSDYITYQTAFLPDSTVIDTFYSPIDTAQINQIILRNSQYPIQHAAWDGKRFGNPAYWTVNEAMKTHEGYGGFDGVNGGGYLGNLTTSRRPAIENGKIYQTVSLPAGDYRLELKFEQHNGRHQIRKAKDAMFVAVAIGDVLPDIARIESEALAYVTIDPEAPLKSDVTLYFTLTKAKTISLGFVVNMVYKGNATLRCSDVNLFIEE